MIKKLLLLILVCILAYGVFSSWAYGFNFKMGGVNFKTSSYAGIAEKVGSLNSEIDTLETKNTTDYKNALNKKQAAVNYFENSKKAYDDMAAGASVEEIREANKREEYFLDYLWMKIGTYANNSDIKVLINPNYEAATIDFSVSGQYIAVINFIYDLENDSELAFNIDNLVMQGGSSAAVTKASFQVRNINIITSEAEAN
ncbi:MAG: hypothetical protein J6C46_06295 [Clostridia bacterium]|nr:hypothetical protein [Clostridia bacterium]